MVLRGAAAAADRCLSAAVGLMQSDDYWKGNWLAQTVSCEVRKKSHDEFGVIVL